MTEEKHRIVEIESTILNKKCFSSSQSIVISAHVMKDSNGKYTPTYFIE